jgi:hypothetical protein
MKDLVINLINIINMYMVSVDYTINNYFNFKIYIKNLVLI